jgi:hypothetical protein
MLRGHHNIIDKLKDLGMSEADCILALELAEHAANQALDSLFTAVAVAPSMRIASTAKMVALRMLEVNIRESFNRTGMGQSHEG